MTDRSGGADSLLAATLVLASDVHLQHMADKRARLLLDVLARLGEQVEVFVLNGDIFDFAFGDSAYYRRKFRPLGEALTAVAARGVRVIFVEGNHEFHMDRMGWRGVEIVQERDLVLTLSSGERVKVMHGDLLTDDRAYRLFRAAVKSPAARACAAFIPGGWLDAYSLRHAKISRAQDRYRTLHHDRILAAFDRWLARDDCEHGIIGHFHVPYAEERRAGSGLMGLMLSVESWDRPNLLVFQDGRFQRVYLREPGLPFVREALHSICR